MIVGVAVGSAESSGRNDTTADQPAGAATDVVPGRPPTSTDLRRLRRAPYFMEPPHVWKVIQFPWWGGIHQWTTSNNPATCPSGCAISFRPPTRRIDLFTADVLLYHPAGGGDVRHQPPAVPFSPGQRYAMFAAENFPSMRDPVYAAKFNAQFTYRAESLFRDGVQYLLRAFEGATAMPATATAWADLGLPPIVHTAHRHRFPENGGTNRALDSSWPRNLSALSTVTWASTHCHSASGREELLLSLSAHVPLELLGGNCLTHDTVTLPTGVKVKRALQPRPLLAMRRSQQEHWMRWYKVRVTHTGGGEEAHFAW